MKEIFVEYWLRENRRWVTKKNEIKNGQFRMVAVSLIYQIDADKAIVNCARGISIMARIEPKFDGKEAFKRARNRAYKALYSRKNDDPITNPAAHATMTRVFINGNEKEKVKLENIRNDVFKEWNNKSMWAPKVTDFEAKMIDRELKKLI
ncbi:MAG: hypothetical protein PHG66_06790 [Candidatus Colwellbacteria bacterium]|nr:hypothetical protein [Candidatus Colwellbacteria bacterium]